MTPKEYLQQYKRLDSEINRLMEEKQRWIELATKITPTYSDAPAGGSGDSEKIPKSVEKIDEWERKINEKIDELVDLREEIEGLIATVKNRDYRTLLHLRYIDGYTWKQVAVEMHYCCRQVARKHGQALRELNMDVLVCPTKSML